MMLLSNQQIYTDATKQPTSFILNLNLQRKRNHSNDTPTIAITHMANTISKTNPSGPIKAS